MNAVALLASTGLDHKTLWNPTILGVLVVASAIGLFCGSVYLLLSTNLGARLGFLVGAAALTGFLVLLSLTWLTTSTPLNSPHGRLAAWEPVERVSEPSESGIAAVRDASTEGERVESEDLALLRPAVDAALVTPAADGGEAPEPSEFAEFGTSSDFLVEYEGLETYETGGETKLLFWHEAQYAVVEYCPVLEVAVPFGSTPPDPECDNLAGTQHLVLERDLGQLRLPPFLSFVAFSVLFAASLLGLHWYEKDRRTQQRTLAPVPST